jgi:hypothetical protein
MRQRESSDYMHAGALSGSGGICLSTAACALANLIAGITAGQSVTAMGFGSGASAPGASDTGLSAAPAHYNAIGSYSFPSPGSVQFNYSLQTTDYGASGMTIQELGLFANSGAVALPSAVGTTNPQWSASVARTLGATLIDANGNVQRCTTAGTSGSSAPTCDSTQRNHGRRINSLDAGLIAHCARPTDCTCSSPGLRICRNR